MPETISAVVFPDRTMTPSALPKIISAAHTGGYTVDGAVLIERDAQGTLSAGQDQSPSPAESGLLHVLADALGVSAGQGTGRAPSPPDADDAALASFTSFIPHGHNAILLAVREPTTDALDTVVTRLGGSIHRRNIGNILDELEATTAEARRKDRRDARNQHRQGHRERIAHLLQHHRRHTP